MSHDDPFGAPLDQPAYGVVPPDFEPLASGDESVLAASGLNAPPSGPRNRAAAVAIATTVVLGGLGVAATAGAFKYFTKDKPAPVAVKTPSPTASRTPSAAPSPTPTTAAPKPKPAAPRPIAGKPQQFNKANTGTLGQPYAVTLPTNWTVARAIRNDRVANLDLRMRNAEKTHSLTIYTLKPAVVSGPLTAAKLATIKAALYKGEPKLTALPGTPKATISGAPAIGFDVTSTTAGKSTTIRTLVWQRAAVTYAASWRVPTPVFKASVPTFDRLVASIKFQR